jgi:hypothetical protein
MNLWRITIKTNSQNEEGEGGRGRIVGISADRFVASKDSEWDDDFAFNDAEGNILTKTKNKPLPTNSANNSNNTSNSSASRVVNIPSKTNFSMFD